MAPEPVRRGVGLTGRTDARRPTRGRAVAVGGALLAQVWWLGAPGALAATAEPLPEPVNRTVGRALGGGTSDGGSAERPAEGERENGPGEGSGGRGEGSDRTGRGRGGASAEGEPRSSGRAPAGEGEPGSPGLLGGLATAAASPGSGPAGARVGDVLQGRIRAGGLPLPGQPAAVPDAFAIASGLLGAVPVQARTAQARASRDGEGVESAAPYGRSGAAAGRPVPPPAGPHGTAAPPSVTGSADRQGPPGGPSGPGGTGVPGAAVAERSAPHGNLAAVDPAAVAADPVGHGLAGTGTAVLAPIAAGLLLTGAAMCKHRGLPRGH
ncbi:hypothetical protein [Kitasatospora sp. A2-31]|uniref:hypothetical protein n=1 Tax=Kitasatospora sp. A2-31 TaxID=2916414 RepID=UPI001EEAECB5|nr:hypothetical protein [Kitasatospora sp. A2-31]MCG6496212.1 hypothetical protein [Kitasatospora sp. A2-31]